VSPSARNLLPSNAATLVAALTLHWNVGRPLWTYWIQSVIVGYYARRRMLSLRVRRATRKRERGSRCTDLRFATPHFANSRFIGCGERNEPHR